MTTITTEPFGITSSGAPVTRYTLTNDHGVTVGILDYGCTVQSLLVPDKHGQPVDVVLGYDTIEGYQSGSCWFGAFVGRYANRLRGAKFTLNGREYFLNKNDGNNHLHGIYSHQIFSATVEGDTLVFRRISPAGEEGFPGTLSCEIRYTLTDDNALVMDYRAETDEDTILNFTNHSYFNLNGSGDVLNHHLTLLADTFAEGSPGTLPTGRLLPVENTPMDFRAGKTIGRDILSPYEQLTLCRGYDHSYSLGEGTDTPTLFARATGDVSGITMEAFTTQPAVQLYTGNFVDTDTYPQGKGGTRYPRHGGFCLETQHHPCSPDFPHFPSTLLRPGELYHHITMYRFSAE